MGKRELVALLNLSSWCLVMVEWLFLVVPWGCLRFVMVVFHDHTHLLFLLCLAQGQNAVTSVNLEPATPRLKSSTVLLHSQAIGWSAVCDDCISWSYLYLSQTDQCLCYCSLKSHAL